MCEGSSFIVGGGFVVIFFQVICSVEFDVQVFNSLGVKLVVRVGVLVVLIVIKIDF